MIAVFQVVKCENCEIREGSNRHTIKHTGTCNICGECASCHKTRSVDGTEWRCHKDINPKKDCCNAWLYLIQEECKPCSGKGKRWYRSDDDLEMGDVSECDYCDHGFTTRKLPKIEEIYARVSSEENGIIGKIKPLKVDSIEIINFGYQSISHLPEDMAALPFVNWDRFVLREKDAKVYGWIKREDAHEDFVILIYSYRFQRGHNWVMEWCTSSEKFSKEINKAFGGEEADHSTCQRVEDSFTIKNCVRL